MPLSVDVSGDGEGQRDGERGEDRQQRPDFGVRDPHESEAERDRHQPEERGRDQREHDRIHRANLPVGYGRAMRSCAPMSVRVTSALAKPASSGSRSSSASS